MKNITPTGDFRRDMSHSRDYQPLRSYCYLVNDQVFQRLESSAQRIEYILERVRPFGHFRKDVQQKVRQYREQHMKCQIRSEKFWRSGIDSFHESNYKSANEWFRKAILSAPFPTELDSYGNALGLSFAAKSVVDFQMKNYLSALFAANCSLQFFDSIEMLLQRIYCLIFLHRYEESAEMYHQLIDRMENDPKLNTRGKLVKDFEDIEDRIVRLMRKDNRPGIFMTATSDLCEDIPEGQFWIHPTCGLESAAGRGRHFVAKQFAPKGTALMIEQPFSKVQVDRSNRCGNCDKTLIHELWPCVGCDELVFCSKKCFDEVYNKYHKYECTFLGYFDGLGAPYIHAFRTISRIGVQRVLELEHKKTDTDFKQYIATNQSEDALDYELMYRAFSSLADNISHCDKFAKFILSFKSTETALMLFNGSEIDFKSFVVLADICFHMCRKVTTNSFGQILFQQKDPKRLVVANCANIVGSLFNHSCDPNSKWSYSRGRLVFTSDRDIEIGDEINISYGPTIRIQDLVQRQSHLRNGYFFSCRCGGCIKDAYSHLTLSCPHCSGPVICNLPLPKHLADTKTYCLQCGEVYQNFEKFKNIFESLKAVFEKTIANLDIEQDIDVSLVRAERSLKGLMKIVCKRSAPLTDYVIKMMAHLKNYGKLEEALRFGQFIAKTNLDALIEEPLIDIVVYEYLFQMTDCYYQYMKSKNVLDTNQWNLCLTLYSRLLRVLYQKKASAERERSQTEEKTEMIQSCAEAIRLKKSELKELVELCKQRK